MMIIKDEVVLNNAHVTYFYDPAWQHLIHTSEARAHYIYPAVSSVVSYCCSAACFMYAA